MKKVYKLKVCEWAKDTNEIKHTIEKIKRIKSIRIKVMRLKKSMQIKIGIEMKKLYKLKVY